MTLQTGVVSRARLLGPLPVEPLGIFEELGRPVERRSGRSAQAVGLAAPRPRVGLQGARRPLAKVGLPPSQPRLSRAGDASGYDCVY